MNGKFIAAGIIASLLNVSAAHAGPKGQTDSTASQNQSAKTTQFGDWLLICRNATGQPSETAPSCELVQTLVLNGQKTPFAKIAIGRLRPGLPLQITVLVPHNVTFPSVVGVAIDEKDKSPVNLAWTRCIAAGCFASGTFREDIQKKWSALDSQGRVTFKDGNGQDVSMPISFKGLKSALEALTR